MTTTTAPDAFRHAQWTVGLGALLSLAVLLFLPGSLELNAVITLLCSVVAAVFAALRYRSTQVLFDSFNQHRPFALLRLIGATTFLFLKYLLLAYLAWMLLWTLAKPLRSPSFFLTEAGLFLRAFLIIGLPWLVGSIIATIIVVLRLPKLPSAA